MEQFRSVSDVEAARILGLAPQTLRNWRHDNKGPRYAKLGRRVIYRMGDLMEYLRENMIEPAGRS